MASKKKRDDVEVQVKVDEIQETLDDVCFDWPRDKYRKFLELLQTNITVSLEALDEADRRDGSGRPR